MLLALNCLHKLKEETRQLFFFDTWISEDNSKADSAHLMFERLFWSLDAVVINGAKEALASQACRSHPAVVSAFLEQTSSEIPTSHDIRCPFAALKRNDKNDCLDPDEMRNNASRLLVYKRRVELHMECYGRSCEDHDNGLYRDDISNITQIANEVHIEAKPILHKLHLWNSVPAIARRHASYLPEDALEDVTNFEDINIVGKITDCLGRYPLLCFLDVSFPSDNVRRKVKDLFNDIDWYQVGEEDRINMFNRQDILGRSALHVACQKGQIEIAQRLLVLGASPRLTTSTGALPLHYAAASGEADICKLLLSVRGPFDALFDQYNGSPLLYAIKKGNVEATKVLLQSELFDSNDTSSNASLLWHAVIGMNDDVVKCLLDAGANPTLTCNHGLFHKAVLQEMPGTMRELGRYNGISMDTRDGMYENTPLISAAVRNFVEGVQYLTSRLDVNVNAVNNLFDTPLIVAARSGHQEIVKILTSLPRTRLFVHNKKGETATDQAKSETIVAMINEEILRRGGEIQMDWVVQLPRDYPWTSTAGELTPVDFQEAIPILQVPFTFSASGANDFSQSGCCSI